MNPKRLLLLLPLAVFASCSTQPTKHPDGVDFQSGTWRLGGDLSYASNGTGTVNGEGVGLGGAIGYFVTDTVEVGLGGDFETVNLKQNPEDLENAYLSLYGRYYTSSVGATRAFGELELGLGTTTIGPGEIDLAVYSLAIGLAHFLGEDWAVEMALGYTNYAFPSDPNPDTNSWSGSLGLSYYF